MKGLLIGVGLIILLGAGSFLINGGGRTGQSPTPFVPVDTHMYVSPAAGISFNYPTTYKVEERSDRFEGQPISVITLTDKNVTIPDMSEGPTAISIIEVPDASNAALSAWVEAKSISNFYLSQTKQLTQTTTAGEPSVSYAYSGLYENDAVALKHNGKVYLFFVSWIDAQSQIRADFQNLLKSVQFTN